MNGRDVFVDGAPRVSICRYRRENIGFIFQTHNLIPFLKGRRSGSALSANVSETAAPLGIRLEGETGC
jgi:hypothetical protein